MSIVIVNSEKISTLINNGIASAIDASYCSAFDEYLCKEYPWVKYTDRIDWEQVKKPYKRLNWQEADVEETTNFIKSTCMGRENFDEVCIVYGANQPGLLVNFDYACNELEHIAIFGWATRFMVGVRRNQFGFVKLDYDCFVEIDFIKWLTVPC